MCNINTFVAIFKEFKMKKKNLIITALLFLVTMAQAGGLLTNTNQNIAFNRNFARDGVIAIDGVYSNPAGVAFLDKGLHLSFNAQSAFQTRDINSSIQFPAFQGTPYELPFRLNGGNEQGVKYYKGTASAPFIPSVQAALNYEKWGFQASFALVGGGGKATFNDGLGSFERQVAIIPALLAGEGLGSQTPGYSLNSYMNGQQYIFGLQLGSTYKFNEHWAAYGGLRFNYVLNKYQGSITDITANINGQDERLYDYFEEHSISLTQQAAQASALAATLPAGAQKTALEAAVAQLNAGADKMNMYKEKVADKYLDCTQTGWGVTPIIGVDFRYGALNIGTRFEFGTNLNIQNNTKRDDTGMFKDGVNTPNDIPALWTIGAQYSVLSNVRAMVSYHYYFDKDADMADDKQKLLSGNTQEILAGAEWDVTKDVMVSAGMQHTSYGLGDGSFLSDMSFVTSSTSVGFGASIRVTKNARLNLAYFWTDYDKFNKSYTMPFKRTETDTNPIMSNNTDQFTRTNKVFGAGIDIDF